MKSKKHAQYSVHRVHLVKTYLIYQTCTVHKCICPTQCRCSRHDNVYSVNDVHNVLNCISICPCLDGGWEWLGHGLNTVSDGFGYKLYVIWLLCMTTTTISVGSAGSADCGMRFLKSLGRICCRVNILDKTFSSEIVCKHSA